MKWELNLAIPIYRTSLILDRSRGVKRCRDLIGSIDAFIEKVSKAKRSSMDQGSIKELSRGQKLSRLIDLAIERFQDCDKKQLKSSIDKLGIERCRAVEIA